MTTPDPDLLRRQIEHTQQNLSTDVDLLTEKVTPSQVARRRVNRARRTMTSVRDRVMGSDSSSGHSAKDRVSDTASSVADTASSMASDAAQTAREAAQGTKNAVQEAPRAIRRGTEGNPIAAGLIMFGAGWLLSTLAPPSKAEEELAERATTWAREHSGPVKEELGTIAEEVKENLREPAQHAAESVRSTATDAVQTVRDDAGSAAEDVRGRAGEAKDTVQDNRS
jgi:hypothetical protein